MIQIHWAWFILVFFGSALAGAFTFWMLMRWLATATKSKFFEWLIGGK